MGGQVRQVEKRSAIECFYIFWPDVDAPVLVHLIPILAIHDGQDQKRVPTRKLAFRRAWLPGAQAMFLVRSLGRRVFLSY